jgi:hypothetical protein
MAMQRTPSESSDLDGVATIRVSGLQGPDRFLEISGGI